MHHLILIAYFIDFCIACRNDERLSNLRHEYGNILDRERRRKARNEKIMSGLENIERHTCVINAKTEHLKLMRVINKIIELIVT
jgi:hypothetical protein